MQLNGCTVLITGASAGIGREFARQLAGRVAGMVLVARRHDRLEQLRDELTRQQPKLNVQIYAADLSRGEDVDALCNSVDRSGTTIDFLINNAGLGDRGRFATGSPERARDIVLVNVLTLTVLTRRFLPPMLERRRGAILNVSSCASFLPIGGMAVYAASKAYVTSLSEALRMEVGDRGVTITALCPGPVHTEFDSVALRPNEPAQRAPEFTYVSVEDVVRAGIEGVEYDRPIVIPGIAMKLAMLLVKLTPMPILRVFSRLARAPSAR